MPRSGPSATSGHSLRNPGRQVQLSHPRAGKSKATRASDDLRLASLRKSRSLLNAAIDAEFLRREGALADIVKSSGKKAAYIRSLLGSASQFKATRAPTLRNAVVHQRCIDQPEGSNKTLQEIREDLAEDERLGLFDLTRIDKTERDRLMKQLVEHRKLKRKGIRATTKAQQLDNTKTGICLGNAIGDLFERTGARGIVMLSRGKADDPTVPHIVDSDGASGFFMSAFGVSKVEVIRKFEQYNCSRDDGTDEKNGVREMRKDIGSTLLEGFSAVTSKTQTKMEYLNYDVAIREAKGVELAGWPVDIKMADHANWSAETLRRIRAALHSGTIHWVRMTKSQHDELISTHNAQREVLGAGSLKRRKQRSDKGEVRGPQKRKRKVAGKKTRGSRRREEEEEEDDSDDEEEDDSDKDDDDAAIERPTHATGVAAINTVTAPPTFTPGVGLTSTLAAVTPALTAQPFDGSAHPQFQILPEHLPSLPDDLRTLGFDFDDPELLEMLADPDAWKSSEGFTLPTDPESRAFAASFSLDNDPTSALISSNANAGGSSKPNTVSQENDKSTPPPKKRSKMASGEENVPPAEGEGEPVKKQRKKRSDAGKPKGPRKPRDGAGRAAR
ncbi:hypothetical protein C8F04DRAFT_1258162 [Mycena alexandri]|uniref:Uncharacterized protein n=1 Tax=Mycena alexandri TaxID=1745969 RepID=A0AAD6X8R7_9AGAR|nr:hypothetical protein C8F04DRAFT_1258162 [Mycena alexandri]